MENWNSIEELCSQYLGGRPAPAVVQMLKSIAQERSEVRDFAHRIVRLMGTAKVGARNFSPMAAFGIFWAKDFLPGAWGGKIPPITAPGRHKIIDDYIASNPWSELGSGTLMLEVGCAFPPTTAIDVAQRFPDWKIIGSDSSFDPYLLYDRDQSYTCLDANGQTRYFQALPTANVKTMADYAGLRARVPELFARLSPKLPADNGDMCAAEDDGCRLIRWPLKQFESANLKLVQAGVGSEGLPQANLIRCFNVLMYYDTAFLRQFETWVASQLQDGGLAIAGGNSPNGSEAYFSVYRKEGDQLVEKELAFSVDLIRPLGIMPWFSLHDDNATNQRLAQLIRRIRSDVEFCARFDDGFDQLLKQNGLLIRDADGCLAPPPEQLPFEKISQLMAAVGSELDRAGFTSRAAEALGKQGIRAWRNNVGYLAVDPQTLR
jgi:hypothetical protein